MIYLGIFISDIGGRRGRAANTTSARGITRSAVQDDLISRGRKVAAGGQMIYLR